ncbi:metal dependent phosphohydrolase [Aminomonas paucivorans DSM 12260]|uniref:Metal dependent phosphohydrolase n=1 Tax=Aminomonas paucivorans DSM 12260 TaxID=584708 RepID=E3CZ51_9BACT|nr:CHASE2 domain-containing protein [Aminomonas paucivorans]EFQ22824.1 metal dependent phosphohydrolase [Aminomonas paucivorans DSM 12260]
MIPKAWRGRRSGFSLLVLAAGLLGALLGASPPAPVRDLDRRAFDLRLSLLPEVPVPLEVVLVLAREETLARMGRWPWPRRYHAALLDRLGEARTVVLDILFPEGGDPEDDALLARAAARHGRVVAAIHLAPGQGKAPPRILPPYDALFRGVADVGVTNVEADEDGVFRYAVPLWPVAGGVAPSLSLAGVSLALGLKPEVEESPRGLILRLGKARLDLDGDRRVWVRFSRVPPRVFEYGDVLEGKVPPEAFRDRIVVVGVAAAGAGDVVTAPNGGGVRSLFGAQFNGETIRTLLGGGTPRWIPPWAAALLGALVASLGAVLALFARPLWAALGFGGLVVLLLGGEQALLASGLWAAPLAGPLTPGVLTFGTGLYLRFRVLHGEERTHRLSVFGILDLVRETRDPKEIPERLASVLAEIRAQDGIEVESPGLSFREVFERTRALGVEEALEGAGKEAVVLETPRDPWRFRMIVPLPEEEETRYLLLRWRRSLPLEQVRSVAALAVAADWFARALTEAKKQKETLYQTVAAMVEAIDAKDPVTAGHSRRVCDLSVELARHLGADERTLEEITFGGIIHDVGKLGIPDAVLGKQGKLTDEEFALIRSHPSVGERILAPVSLPEVAKQAMAEHHEKWNGRGYPRGLKGTEISLAGRIVAVADVYDALASDRPYKKGWPLAEVCDLLYKQSREDFDPDVVQAFWEMKAPEDWVPPDRRPPTENASS